MSKKNKGKKPVRPVRPTNTNVVPFRDMTAERRYTLQMAQATKLYQEQRLDEAIELLEPLAERFSDRAEMLNLLGVCYAEVGQLSEARSAFERVLEISKGKVRGLTRYNLTQLYVLTGFTFLAYEQSLLLDCFDLPQIEDTNKCKELKKKCRETMEQIAGDYAMPFDKFVPYAIKLDRGRLALAQSPIDFGTARARFEEAIELNSQNPTPYNNLALIYQSEGDYDQAIAQSRYVLEKLQPNNLHALSNLIRLLVVAGRSEEAQVSFEQIKALPLPADNPGDVVKLAEAYIALEDDQGVFDLLQPFLGEPAGTGAAQTLAFSDEVTYRQALTYGMVAAANLGRLRRAGEIAEVVIEISGGDVLIERTHFALQNNERGPREGGRFFYWNPDNTYPAAMRYFRDMMNERVRNAGKRTEEESQQIFRPFFEKFGQAALETMAYLFWTTAQGEFLMVLLAQILNSGVDAAVELVRRLAFGRSGDETQRVLAASALIQAGLLALDETVTIWLGLRPTEGTVEQLVRRLEKMDAERMARENEEFSDAVAEPMNEALVQMQLGNRPQAIALYREVLRKQPNLKQALHNLASAVANSGDLDEALRLLDRALKVDPQYVHAQISRTRVLLAQEKIEEAEAQLNETEQNLSGYYRDELISFYTARLRLDREQERYTEMVETAERLLEIDPENGEANEIAGRGQLMGLFGGFTNWLREMQENYRAKRLKQWGKMLKPDVRIEPLVEGYTKDDLLVVINAWRMSPRSGLKKADYKAMLLEILKDESQYEHLVWHVMSEEERQALKVLLELGGYTAYPEWQVKAGFEDTLQEEQPHMSGNWQKLPGSLLKLGVVFIGNANVKLVKSEKSEELIAVVPIDLREVLSRSLATPPVGE